MMKRRSWEHARGWQTFEAYCRNVGRIGAVYEWRFQILIKVPKKREDRCTESTCWTMALLVPIVATVVVARNELQCVKISAYVLKDVQEGVSCYM